LKQFIGNAPIDDQRDGVMHRVVTVAILLILTAESALAKSVRDPSPLNGLTLASMCHESGTLRGWCLGYIEGVLNASDLTVACIPDKIGVDAAELIVTGHIKAHPMMVLDPAWVLVKNAMIDAFPCNGK
jgi:hypothetical protein